MALVSAIQSGFCSSCGEQQTAYFRVEDRFALEDCRCGGQIVRTKNERVVIHGGAVMGSIGRSRRLKEKGLIDIGGESPDSLAREGKKMERYREEREEKVIEEEMDAVMTKFDDSFFFKPGESDTGDIVVDSPTHHPDADTFVGGED